MPPNEKIVAPPNKKIVAPPNENIVAPPNENIVAPPNENIVAPPNENIDVLPNENFDLLGSTISNLSSVIYDNIPSTGDISKKCECILPKYEEIDLLNKELESLNLQKNQLLQEYDLANKPPDAPLLNLTCCENNISCYNGSCGSLFDDCIVKEKFEGNITENNNFFSFNNMSSIILLIILILLIFLHRK